METLAIKNMVCARCVSVIERGLMEMGLEIKTISLGHVVLTSPLNLEKQKQITDFLEKNGFALLMDSQSITVEKIKNTVIALVHRQDPNAFKYSVLLSEKLAMDYGVLSQTFSKSEGVTLEKYIILQKIERVKAMLLEPEATLSTIAYAMGYSSVAHLSSQFKKVTGITPSQYKKSKVNLRVPLDKVGKKV